MGPFYLALASFAVVFTGGIVGLLLHRALPAGWTTGGPRDMTGAVVGLLTLLLALVLGLLIWTAFGVYTAQKAAIQTIAMSGLRFDQAMQDYGAEAAEGRKLLKTTFKSAIDQIWGGNAEDASFTTDYARALAHQKDLEAYVNALEPSTDQQRAAKSAALAAAGAVGQSRTQMVFALIEPVAYALVAVVVGWATLLFCGYGLLSKLHPMSLVSLTFGALAIGSAIYCIVDMSSPFDGLFQVSAAPIASVLDAVDSALETAGAHR